jgi:DNA polymerase III epsilon subunit-like protein
MERAMDEGIPEKDAIDEFLSMWARCGFRLGHNVSFDERIIRIAIKRYFGDELADKWKAGEKKCTGNLSKKICKMLPTNKFGYKMPKLTEAYKFFTGRDMEGAHGAMADTLGCLEVYWGILDHKEGESAPSPSQPRQSMGLEDCFKFGKHKGDQLEDVISDDPGYIEWVISEGVVIFDESAMEHIARKGAA